MNTKFFKLLTNIYVLILVVFVVWMLFFDENSYLYHRELDKEIYKLEKLNTYYKGKIVQDREMIERLQDSSAMERYAREQFLMKRKGEEVFLIEFDTIN